MSSTDHRRVGYVLKMYPRFSETFIVNEILAHEAAGQPLEIFSLRPPADGRFHASLAEVTSPVTYLYAGSPKPQQLWDRLAGSGAVLPRLWEIMPELLAAEVRDAFQAMELAILVVERGVDHLHAHFGSVSTTVARLAALLAGITYSFTAHAKDIFHESVEEADLRRKLADAAAVVTVSDFNLAYLRETFGPDAARVHRIYNGLDLERFSYDEPTDRPAEIIAVGRLVEKKGFDDLIDACALLAGQGRAFRCRIVGGGALEDQLRAQVHRLGLSGWVELLGPQPQGRVMQLVSRAALLATPCVIGADGNRDGLPTVLLEAMALGTPCVATDVTGIPEVLHDGETGLHVDQHDAKGLAAACARLMDDVDLRVRLARNARALIEAEFDVHRAAERVRGLFEASAAPVLEELSA